jgi:hypothetical protein
MPGHSLARAKSCWKSIKAAVALLLAVVLTIPVVQVGATILHSVSFSNFSQSRQGGVNATLARARRTHPGVVTHNARNLSLRQWGTDDAQTSFDSPYPSPSTWDRREIPGKDRQKSTGSDRTYRTVCVRLCDGYYFPISFAVPRKYLARDGRRCQQSCGAEGRLFYHGDANADIADMTDLEGQPYSKLQSAFLYRTAYFPNCKCQPHPWEKEAIERHRRYALAAAARNGNKAAAMELYAPQGTSNLANKDAQAAPTFRPTAANRASRVNSATISSEKSNAPAAAEWRDEVYQGRN